MRRYVDPVEVRKGRVRGPGAGDPGVEGPEQFLWRGRLWQVRAVLAHWVETGPWWQSAPVRAVIGSDETAPPSTHAPSTHAPDARAGSVPTARADLLAERELWRVEAARGRDASGVFDLSFDWEAGSWQLVGCAD
ncbi:MAG: DUF6504 family protein [Nocardioidaceae bacterium]